MFLAKFFWKFEGDKSWEHTEAHVIIEELKTMRITLQPSYQKSYHQNLSNQKIVDFEKYTDESMS